MEYVYLTMLLMTAVVARCVQVKVLSVRAERRKETQRLDTLLKLAH